ncbi:right-handed parallel beta-helix repeat-containing protein [Roseicyclus persicicus]|uniref:right-handed parallel beta-helix repeat-containing protein n=1 Tax=Roseicyclus persicicus TaxID=2650661 RepID=UPI001EEFA1F9|nr:hypothetical protein [Roseibacterium persicicum]
MRVCLGLALAAVTAAATAAQTVDVLGLDPDPATLAEALAVAPAGAEILLTGSHRGNFVIDRPLTLRASGAAELDGAGAGTVLTILADDVQVEGLAVTGSAAAGDYWQAWGPAGLRVEGDRARLSGLTVTGNAWGILLRGGEGTVLRLAHLGQPARRRHADGRRGARGLGQCHRRQPDRRSGRRDLRRQRPGSGAAGP